MFVDRLLNDNDCNVLMENRNERFDDVSETEKKQ